MSSAETAQQLLEQAPPAVQDFVTQKLPAAAQELGTQFQLHIDQIGTLEFELFLMLVGKTDPVTFAQDLQEAGFTPDTTQRILAEVNKNVFIPLRTAEEAGARPTPVMTPPPIRTYTPPQAPAAPTPLVSVPEVSAPPVYQPPEQIPPPASTAPVIPMVPAYETVAATPVISTAPRTPWSQPATSQAVPPSIPVVPAGPPPPPRLPGTDPYREPVE